MKTMIATTLSILVLIAVVSLDPARAGGPYETDDYGFPVEQDSTSQRRSRSGERFWSNQRAARNLRHSHEYSRDMYRYSQSTNSIKPAVIKSESEEMGRCIEQAERELAAITSDSEGNPETVAALKSINEHLANAKRRHSRLHKECCKTSVDGKVTMQCSADINEHLENAIMEHTALMRSLEIQVPPQESTPSTSHQHK